MDKKGEKQSRPKTEKHLESLLPKGSSINLKEIQSEYSGLVQGITKTVGEKYGKTSISSEMSQHYAEAMAHLMVGSRTIREIYRVAEKEQNKKEVKSDRESIAKYVRDIAKKTGHPFGYSDKKSDAEVVSRVKQLIDGAMGEGSFDDLYESFKKDKNNDEILSTIVNLLSSEHQQTYRAKVMDDYTLDLDSNQTKQFSAAHGSYLKQYGIKSIKHEKLAASKSKLHGHMARHISTIEDAIQQAYRGNERREQE